MEDRRSRRAAARPRGALRGLHPAIPGLCRKSGIVAGALAAEFVGEILCNDGRRDAEPRRSMNALVTAAIYFGSFLEIGLIANLAVRRWLNLRDIDLSEVRSQLGPNHRKS